MAIKITKEANKKNRFTSGVVTDVDVNLNLRNRIYTLSFLVKEKDII